MSPRYINGKLLLFDFNGDIVYESSVHSIKSDQEANLNEKETTLPFVIQENQFEEIDNLITDQDAERFIENRLKEKKANEIEEQLALDALV
jgi:hypothetical protein